jgi:hypothetical protein
LRVASIIEPGSLIFGTWGTANVLYYHKYVGGLLDEVEVYYTPPLREQIDHIVDTVKPKRIYLTYDPGAAADSVFRVKSIQDIIPGYRLYLVTIDDPG